MCPLRSKNVLAKLLTPKKIVRNNIMSPDTHRSDLAKIKYSLYSAILFAVISSPPTYKLVQSLLGRLATVAVNGKPTPAGVAVHSLVFFAIIYGLMHLPI